MPIIIVTILIIFIGLIVYAVNNNPYSKMSSREVASMCFPMEGNAMHIHPHLTIIIDKQALNPPTGIGVNKQKNCMHPVHIHDENGVIHIESPIRKDFVLGDFFAVWGKPFSNNQILDYKVDEGHGLKFYVDGKESGDFENLVLSDRQEIVIDYYRLEDGPAPLPKPFDWNQDNDENAPRA